MRSVKFKLIGSFAILFILTVVLVASSLEFINSGDIRAGANDLILTLGIVMVIYIVALAWMLTVNITSPLKVTTEVLNRISTGDLQLEPLPVKRKDDFGRMTSSVNQTLVTLQQTVKRMQNASNTIADTSAQLYTSSAHNSEAAKHVAEAIQEVARSSLEQAQTAGESGRVVDEMAIGVQRIAETTGDVSELSAQTALKATNGSENIFDVTDKMHRLSQSIETASETIHQLEIQSGKISDISTIIGGIAYQTNLLALNAAIEAARAGEHGKGFAVVAGEVRKLASQSEESSRHIIDLISSIQKDTVEAVALMGKSLAQVKGSMSAVELAEQSFKEIVVSTSEVSSRIQEAAASAEQLAASSEEVAASITNMEHLARKSAELSEEVAAATKQQLVSSENMTSSSQTMSGVSKDLESIVTKFKV